MINPGLYSQLAGDSAVAAIVGARIFGAAAAPDLQQLPCLVLSFVGGAVDPTMTTSGVFRQRLQVDAFAESEDVAVTLREAAIRALDGWSGAQADGTEVLQTLVLNPGTDFASEERIFRCMAEFYVFYTLPTS